MRAAADGLQPAQQPVERPGAALLPRGQPLSQGFVAARQCRQSVQESPKIESGTAHDHRQASPGGDSGDHLAGRASVIARGETRLGVQHVKQMVGYAAARGGRRFGRADIEAAVQLEGIAIDDFTREGFGDAQRQLALSRCGRTHDRHQRISAATSCHRNVCGAPGLHASAEMSARPGYTEDVGFRRAG